MHATAAAPHSIVSRVVSVAHRVAYVTAAAAIGAVAALASPWAAVGGLGLAAVATGWKAGQLLESNGGGVGGFFRRVGVHAVTLVAAGTVAAGVFFLAPAIATLATGAVALAATTGYLANEAYSHHQHEELEQRAEQVQ